MKVERQNKFYPRRVRYISILVIFGIAFISYLFPRFFEEKVQLTNEDKTEIIEITDIPITIQEKIILPPSRHNIPVLDEEIEIIDTLITIKEYEPFDFDQTWDRPPISTPDKGFIFIPHTEKPKPIGGYKALGKNIIYPPIAQEAGVYGTVTVSVFINKFGTITEIQVAEGYPNTGLNEAAIDAIMKTKWKAAKQRDKSVGVWINIPINFSLE